MTGVCCIDPLARQTSIAKLPARIPVHFDAAGQANGWGSPSVLWLLLGLQIVVGASFFLVAPLSRRFPRLVHFGTRRLSDFTPLQRERILPVLTGMTETLSIPATLLLAYVIREIIRVASSPHPEISLGWTLAFFLLSNAAILIYYLRRIATAADTPDFTSRPAA